MSKKPTSSSCNRHSSNSDSKLLLKDALDCDDDENIVEVDDDLDLDKAFSQDDDDEDDEDLNQSNHDDDDDVEYGQSRLIHFNSRNKTTKIENDLNKIERELEALENFRQIYQNEYKLNEHKLHKYFERFFNSIVKKFLCSE